jgi:uncharacterized protein YkwD
MHRAQLRSLYLCALGIVTASCEPTPADRTVREPPAPPAPIPPATTPTPPPATSPPTAPPVAAAEALVRLTNVERTRAGRATLRANARLARAAQLQADQVARAGKLEHELPGAAYPRPEDRLAAVGYTWRAFAENLAVGEPDAAGAIAGWMKSPGHRTNLLSASYTELGTAVARDSAGRMYYVQVFGRAR